MLLQCTHFLLLETSKIVRILFTGCILPFILNGATWISKMVAGRNYYITLEVRPFRTKPFDYLLHSFEDYTLL